MKRTISIIIPAYCEEKRVGSTLRKLKHFLETHLTEYKKEIIVVSANSPDKTHEVVLAHKNLFKGMEFRLLKPGAKVGKGRDVQYGMLRAKGDFCIFMDADLATPLKHLNKMVKLLEGGADIVIGARDLRSIHPGFLRTLISQAGNLLAKLMVGIYFSDTQCGFKAFTAEANKACFSKQKIYGWGFDIELLVIALRHKFKIAEIFIHDWRDVEGGTLSKSAIRSSVRTLRELWTIRSNIKAGQYD